ncbi:hypothetical protein [uncultured Desulfobacter sp.]|uniref:tyrosine-type recombinase/integrase n=1 Tax=uncultured Desulfobacter sp. TaxID=240139 RepID=UPI0029F59F8A|nr:hypothetical protein [uncultured Desulfobacter sp.]
MTKARTIYNNSQTALSFMGECMSGKVYCHNGSWYVNWWDKVHKKTRKIYHYKGEKIYSKKTAEKLLSVMQSDVENGTFYIEKYVSKGFSDVIPFINDWFSNLSGLSPATEKGYRSYLKNHIKPFFKKHSQISLPDIQIDILRKFKKELHNKGLSPKMQSNIMFCLHTILDAAWIARRIPAIPPFPKKKEYGLTQQPIKWLPEDRQLAVLNQIPYDHQPIFYFLKYHLRRPAEALALHKEDFFDNVFTIHRSISARVLTDKTKTGEIHSIPCHPDFKPFIDIELDKQKRHRIISPFFFVNPSGRTPGKGYKAETLNRLWNKACKQVGENIRLYAGTKHSSCSQYINEYGLSESDLQVITDHSRLESVRNYAKTEVSKKLKLMSKNVRYLKQPKTKKGDL